MRRNSLARPQPMFRRAELLMLVSMGSMLVLLVVLMARLRDPDTLRALDAMVGADDAPVAAGEGAESSAPAVKPSKEAKPSKENAAASRESPESSGKTAAVKDAGAANDNDKAAKGSSAAKDSATASPRPANAAPLLTDEDEEEWGALQEELQGVADRTLAIQPEEMPAYRRLVDWTDRQSFDAMRRRAKKDATFNDFVQSPAEHRGRLVELVIHARMIRKCPELPGWTVPLHEIWGPTSETGGWLYSAVVVDLPKGMPVGNPVEQKVRLVGYFLKLQGYQPALAKPNAPSLFAPLFIGRVVWIQPKPVAARKSDWWLVGGLLGGFAMVMLSVVLWTWLGPRGRRSTPVAVAGRSASVDAAAEDWLDRAGIGGDHSVSPPSERQDAGAADGFSAAKFEYPPEDPSKNRADGHVGPPPH